MKLIENAGGVWYRLWSVRLALLTTVLSSATTLLAYMQPEKPSWWWGLATAGLGIATAVARLVQQQSITGDQSDEQDTGTKS